MKYCDKSKCHLARQGTAGLCGSRRLSWWRWSLGAVLRNFFACGGGARNTGVRRDSVGCQRVVSSVCFSRSHSLARVRGDNRHGKFGRHPDVAKHLQIVGVDMCGCTGGGVHVRLYRRGCTTGVVCVRLSTRGFVHTWFRKSVAATFGGLYTWGTKKCGRCTSAFVCLVVFTGMVL